ncbi:SDR family oxidoreductase [Millisia brevis]|uniref:SDR family oxidoreductase n=1 Tax=Millisia brevis TaxID=264148 RepID=UPI000829DBB1|nr:SDR family oxidoreductase [Millisia brevis]
MTVVAITGAGRGIGRATARRLAADGYLVAIGDLDADAAREVAGQIPGAIGLPLDVSDPTQIAAFLDRVEVDLGPVDVLINNAGIMPVAPFLEHDDALARRIVDINLHGPLAGMREVLPRMLARGGGHIINVASIAGRQGVPGGVVYSAAKHGVVGMSESIRREYGARGIAVTTVFPAFTNTELIAGTHNLRGSTPVEPEDVAEAIAKVLVSRKPELYVPKRFGLLMRLLLVLPPAVADRLAQLSGANNSFRDVDTRRRAEYDRRISPPTPNG